MKLNQMIVQNDWRVVWNPPVLHFGNHLYPHLKIKREILSDGAKRILQLLPFYFTFDIGIIDIDHEAKVGVQLQRGKDTKKAIRNLKTNNLRKPRFFLHFNLEDCIFAIYYKE